jgi:hypothetical protein
MGTTTEAQRHGGKKHVVAKGKRDAEKESVFPLSPFVPSLNLLCDSVSLWLVFAMPYD